MGISGNQAGVLSAGGECGAAAIVGQKLAAEMVLTGRTLNGQEALPAGLVNGVADDPETLVTECVARVSQLSPAAIAVAKKAFYAWDSIHFDKGLARAEQIYLDELMNTADAQEGITAHGRPQAAVAGQVRDSMDYEISAEEFKALRDRGRRGYVAGRSRALGVQTATITGSKQMPMGEIPSRFNRSLTLKTTSLWFAITACGP